MAKNPEYKQQKQYCSKFNKDFKNDPHQKKKNLRKSGQQKGPEGEESHQPLWMENSRGGLRT